MSYTLAEKIDCIQRVMSALHPAPKRDLEILEEMLVYLRALHATRGMTVWDMGRRAGIEEMRELCAKAAHRRSVKFPDLTITFGEAWTGGYSQAAQDIEASIRTLSVEGGAAMTTLDEARDAADRIAATPPP